MKRRTFLSRSFALGLNLGSARVFLGPSVARAQSAPPARRMLVVVIQRGAMDGLMAVPPLEQEAAMRALRPDLTMTGADGVLELAQGYGLHPSFGALHPLFADGQLAVVHGVGSPEPTRSHFDAQAYLESGTTNETLAAGWLGRALEALPPSDAPVRAVALAGSTPLGLAGAERSLTAADLAEFRIGGRRGRERVRRALDTRMRALWADADHAALQSGADEAVAALDHLAALGAGALELRAGYANHALGTAFSQLATLVHADAGVELALVESGGWDTHVDQGTVQGGFAQAAQPLGDALATFWDDLGSKREQVTVVTFTEFGRTVTSEGANGTDHGRGSASFVLGTQVSGGRVFGSPGVLDRDALDERTDVPVSIDHRAVSAAVLEGWLGVDPRGGVFPGWSGQALAGLLRG